MRSLSGILQYPYVKIIFFFCLSSIIFVSTSATKFLAKQAGGIACFLFALLLILSLIKTLLSELVKNSETRNKAKRIIEICHRYLGWAIFMLIIYHSLFYLYQFVQGVNNISVNYIITGLIATAAMILVILTGSNKNVKLSNLDIKIKSVYFSHILMTIILALLIVFHFNFE